MEKKHRHKNVFVFERGQRFEPLLMKRIKTMASARDQRRSRQDSPHQPWRQVVKREPNHYQQRHDLDCVEEDFQSIYGGSVGLPPASW